MCRSDRHRMLNAPSERRRQCVSSFRFVQLAVEGFDEGRGSHGVLWQPRAFRRLLYVRYRSVPRYLPTLWSGCLDGHVAARLWSEAQGKVLKLERRGKVRAGICGCAVLLLRSQRTDGAERRQQSHFSTLETQSHNNTHSSASPSRGRTSQRPNRRYLEQSPVVDDTRYDYLILLNTQCAYYSLGTR